MFFMTKVRNGRLAGIIRLSGVILVRQAGSRPVFFQVTRRYRVVPMGLAVLLLLGLGFRVVL